MNGPIMIIDDSLTVRMDLGEAFRDAGFEIILCASAAEAREALMQNAPAVIVLDILLPDADGIEFLTEIRSTRATEGIPVMLLSSEAEVKDRVRGLTRGASEYIGKPYEGSYVVARAKALLRNAPPESDTSQTILVIDDSLTYREELSDSLVGAGFLTVLASSGEDGLKRAADVHPDAMIVDGVMPGMDGTAVVRKIRLDPGLHAIPCLLLTASEGAAGEIMALDAGADAYVRKGEGTDVILARLGAMLRGAEDSRDRAHTKSLMGPKRILAVDDSLTYLEEIAEQLRNDGYEVVQARSGEEALELLAVEQVDSILLDLLMPGMSGTETCKRVKSLPALRNVPLIMLTALEDPEAVIVGMNAGADDYVAKSVDFEVIKARLRAQLRRKQFEDENRRVREEILKKDAEAHAARQLAETRTAMAAELETKNYELGILNGELEMFAYSVSHDLRQPLRSIDGFGQALIDDYRELLDDRGRDYIGRMQAAAQRMSHLIDGLLALSRVTQQQLRQTSVRIDVLAQQVLRRLQDAEPDRQVEIAIGNCLEASGDEMLVESIMENLLGNAWKFTAGRQPARIEVDVQMDTGTPTYYVRDNGAGFRMDYADKLFAPFQRLHSQGEFPGTGIGLATTQRIVHRHGGRIWAESKPDEGATFYFTLSRGSERQAL
jgi:DNA-binding response OmpR family regulator